MTPLFLRGTLVAMQLSEYRARKKLTLTAMAETVGVSVSSMYRYENGLRWPGRSVVTRIMKATGGKVTANDFVERADNEAA